MPTANVYNEPAFSSRTGQADRYSMLHQEIKIAGFNIDSIYQTGMGCRIQMNTNLADWSGIDTIVGDHTQEPWANTP